MRKIETYDVIIRNGTIYDGSGNPPFIGDLAINDDIDNVDAALIGRIVAGELTNCWTCAQRTVEICNDRDDDCDGEINEGDACPQEGAEIWNSYIYANGQLLARVTKSGGWKPILGFL